VDQNQIVEAQDVDIVLAPASANEQVVVADLQRLWWDIERDTPSLVPREFTKVDLREQSIVEVDRCCTVRDGTSPFPNNLEVQLQLRIRRDVVKRERTLVIVAIRPDIEAWLGALQEVGVGCREGRRQDRSCQRKDEPQPVFGSHTRSSPCSDGASGARGYQPWRVSRRRLRALVSQSSLILCGFSRPGSNQ